MKERKNRGTIVGLVLHVLSGGFLIFTGLRKVVRRCLLCRQQRG